MTRPPNIVRPTLLNLAIDQDLRAWLDLHLWSDTEQRVPHGAYKALITKLLLEYREKVESNATIP